MNTDYGDVLRRWYTCEIPSSDLQHFMKRSGIRGLLQTAAFLHGAEPVAERCGHTHHHTYTYIIEHDPDYFVTPKLPKADPAAKAQSGVGKPVLARLEVFPIKIKNGGILIEIPSESEENI